MLIKLRPLIYKLFVFAQKPLNIMECFQWHKSIEMYLPINFFTKKSSKNTFQPTFIEDWAAGRSTKQPSKSGLFDPVDNIKTITQVGKV